MIATSSDEKAKHQLILANNVFSEMSRSQQYFASIYLLNPHTQAEFELCCTCLCEFMFDFVDQVCAGRGYFLDKFINGGRQSTQKCSRN